MAAITTEVGGFLAPLLALFKGKPKPVVAAKTVKKKTKKEMLQEALLEFKAFENNLKRNKIKVTTLMGQVGCPDNIFPNWAVSHNDQTIDLFSMLGKNRRLEKSKKHISFLNQTYSTKNDYSDSENESIFLAASLPSEIPHTTNDCPLRASPATKILS